MKKVLWLMSVILILAIILSLPSFTSAAAQFKVSDLSISPAYITAGSGDGSVTISVKVTNTGTQAGTYKVELKINNAVEATKDTPTIDVGKETTVIFPVSKTEAGEYNVSIDDLKGTFSVAPGMLEIKNLLIDPREVSPGKEVVISATAQNKSADQPLTYDSLKLFINGTVADKKRLELKAGESTTISFTVTKNEAGNYVVQVGPKSGSFAVKASFLSSLPPLVWGVIGVIALVIILMVVMSLTSPKKKRAKLAARTGGTPRPSQLSAHVQPISVQPTPMQQTPHQPFAPQQMPPPYPGQMQQMPPQAMPPYPGQPQQQMPPRMTPSYPGQPRQIPPQPFAQQQMPSYPGQQQTPQQPTPSYHGQTQQMPPQQRSAYPMQQPKPEQPGMTPAFTPTTQHFGTPSPFGMPPGRAIPQFTVSNLTITPQQVKDGDAVNISAVVINNSTAMGQYSMVLRIGGVVENISELTLNPGTSQTALFTVTKDTPGDYYVEVDGQRGVFTVIQRLPAAFTISNLTIAPERVKQGEPITISAFVTNSGETAGNYSVVLRIKGIAENIEEVELGPGRSQKVVFTITKDAAGFYPVALENLSGKFVVEMDWKG